MSIAKGHVISICIAYEQGVGKGRDNRKNDNPYINESYERIAWQYGYDEGQQWFKEQSPGDE